MVEPVSLLIGSTMAWAYLKNRPEVTLEEPPVANQTLEDKRMQALNDNPMLYNRNPREYPQGMRGAALWADLESVAQYDWGFEEKRGFQSRIDTFRPVYNPRELKFVGPASLPPSVPEHNVF